MLNTIPASVTDKGHDSFDDDDQEMQEITSSQPRQIFLAQWIAEQRNNEPIGSTQPERTITQRIAEQQNTEPVEPIQQNPQRQGNFQYLRQQEMISKDKVIITAIVAAGSIGITGFTLAGMATADRRQAERNEYLLIKITPASPTDQNPMIMVADRTYGDFYLGKNSVKSATLDGQDPKVTDGPEGVPLIDIGKFAISNRFFPNANNYVRAEINDQNSSFFVTVFDKNNNKIGAAFNAYQYPNISRPVLPTKLGTDGPIDHEGLNGGKSIVFQIESLDSVVTKGYVANDLPSFIKKVSNSSNAVVDTRNLPSGIFLNQFGAAYNTHGLFPFDDTYGISILDSGGNLVPISVFTTRNNFADVVYPVNTENETYSFIEKANGESFFLKLSSTQTMPSQYARLYSYDFNTFYDTSEETDFLKHNVKIYITDSNGSLVLGFFAEKYRYQCDSQGDYCDGIGFNNNYDIKNYKILDGDLAGSYIMVESGQSVPTEYNVEIYSQPPEYVDPYDWPYSINEDPLNRQTLLQHHKDETQNSTRAALEQSVFDSFSSEEKLILSSLEKESPFSGAKLIEEGKVAFPRKQAGGIEAAETLSSIVIPLQVVRLLMLGYIINSYQKKIELLRNSQDFRAQAEVRKIKVKMGFNISKAMTGFGRFVALVGNYTDTVLMLSGVSGTIGITASSVLLREDIRKIKEIKHSVQDSRKQVQEIINQLSEEVIKQQQVLQKDHPLMLVTGGSIEFLTELDSALRKYNTQLTSDVNSNILGLTSGISSLVAMTTITAIGIPIAISLSLGIASSIQSIRNVRFSEEDNVSIHYAAESFCKMISMIDGSKNQQELLELQRLFIEQKDELKIQYEHQKFELKQQRLAIEKMLIPPTAHRQDEGFFERLYGAVNDVVDLAITGTSIAAKNVSDFISGENDEIRDDKNEQLFKKKMKWLDLLEKLSSSVENPLINSEAIYTADRFFKALPFTNLSRKISTDDFSRVC